jgi:pimeloyl-ACP methyl ester carboxylesterase
VDAIVTTRGSTLSFVAEGSGMPLLALHGAYSTHHEIRSILEPVVRGRGIHAVYPDLPGMGESTGDVILTADDAVDALENLIDAQFAGERMLVVGHSFGAHLARGLAARRPAQIAGLALLCPLMTGVQDAAPSIVVRDDPGASDGLDARERDEFEGYFVVRTAATAARFRAAVAPAIDRYDPPTVERIMTASEFALDPAAIEVDAPTLIAAARHDAVVGWRRQQGLVDLYPRADAVLVADAGHAMPHERPELFDALLADLISRSSRTGDLLA